MSLLFEKQGYQDDCVDSIIEALGTSENLTTFSPLRQSLQKIQAKNNIPLGIRTTSDDRRLDIVMETGTGKTFTYLKAMFELNAHYHVNHFLIFVPRLAIREGILQNIALTSSYFAQMYGGRRITSHCYSGAGDVGEAARFLYGRGKDLSVLILTSQSIAAKNKATRVLHRVQEHERYGRKSLLENIAQRNPVIIIDEPHLLKGDVFKETYDKHFSRALCLRFGATFPNTSTSQDSRHALSNVVYCLDSLSAFRQYLVKQIHVSNVAGTGHAISFMEKGANKNEVKIAYEREGNAHRATLSYGEDIGVKTGDKNYDGVWIVRVAKDKVHFSDGRDPIPLRSHYELSDEEIRVMVRDAIERHFEKEKTLFAQHIKALSLFFIPRIDDFRGQEPRIKRIFEEEYKKQQKDIVRGLTADDHAYGAYLKRDYDEQGTLKVHEGYFSGDKGTKGSSQEAKEASICDIILRDKVRLLSLQEPLRFVFSVWALQEGWDNPNIFTLCKIAPTSKDTSRRQQVGRGLRLAVNNKGQRITHAYCREDDNAFYDINRLDVIVSNQERGFIDDIQREIQDNSYVLGGETLDHATLKQNYALNEMQARETINLLLKHGAITPAEDGSCYRITASLTACMDQHKQEFQAFLKERYDTLYKDFKNAKDARHEPAIGSSNKDDVKVPIRHNKAQELKDLWHAITREARIVYENIKDEDIINSVRDDFANETIDPVYIHVKTKRYDHMQDKIIPEDTKTLGIRDFWQVGGYERFLYRFAEKEKLPLPFVCRLFHALPKDKIKNHPSRAYTMLKQLVQKAIHRHIINSVNSVNYKFDSTTRITGEDPLYDKDGTPKEHIKAGLLGRCPSSESSSPSHNLESSPPPYLYDKIYYDSDIEHKTITETPPDKKQYELVVFGKLPRINIPTPYKHYNPDFAYLIKKKAHDKNHDKNPDTTLFFIVETKGYDKMADLKDEETMKIKYGRKFFHALNEHIKKEHDNVEVRFCERLPKDKLIDMLQSLYQEEAKT
ncbi:MAG: DEAD/DEAH box helicase family protein [Alphaproteobacteria bacterium GM7ARS4]|nr:DEAD/DEAH box helicase family protein [Alphaproteobacteria bacterium GM7ARS4]